MHLTWTPSFLKDHNFHHPFQRTTGMVQSQKMCFPAIFMEKLLQRMRMLFMSFIMSTSGILCCSSITAWRRSTTVCGSLYVHIQPTSKSHRCSIGFISGVLASHSDQYYSHNHYGCFFLVHFLMSRTVHNVYFKFPASF